MIFPFNAVSVSVVVYDIPCASSQQRTNSAGAVLPEKMMLALKSSCIPKQFRQGKRETLARHTSASSHSHGSVAGAMVFYLLPVCLEVEEECCC